VHRQDSRKAAHKILGKMAHDLPQRAFAALLFRSTPRFFAGRIDEETRDEANGSNIEEDF
jgi:hypothetical protein